MDILTFLRATDLSALQRTCTCFNQRDLVNAVVEYAADEVVSTILQILRLIDRFQVLKNTDEMCFCIKVWQ
jgi:hypothetical protein